MRYLLIILLAACNAALAQPGDGLDSLLNVQRMRAGNRVDSVFEMLDNKNVSLSANEVQDMRFLIAYLPLSDLAAMSGQDLLSNVQLAQRARKEFSWGAQVNDELYRYFVLPHRVSQEPFVHWREKFLNEIGPRVKNMGMTEAALEVNHWCHEHATYQPSDSRDQDPLTTIRAGLGRCEEEMILAICALRSVGIPARQCYTPYWAHTDDNHAWVEVWTDGQWHYFGACEPDVKLDRAWFSAAAARAMLVVSTAYGDYRGSEPVLKRYTRSTLINSTAVYGDTRTLEVVLKDENGKPLPKQNIMFNLYNYGVILPAMSLETDSAGRVTMVCGKGDWIVSAGKDKSAALALVGANENHVELQLGEVSQMRMLHEIEYTPPPEMTVVADSLRDSLFACRIAGEDSLRKGFWTTWATEAGIAPKQIKPDSDWVWQQTKFHRGDLPDSSRQQLLDYLRLARGNWGNLWMFLFKVYPGEDIPHFVWGIRGRLDLLRRLTEKDYRDFSLDMSEDLNILPFCQSSTSDMPDDQMRREWSNLKSRLGLEPTRPWYENLRGFLNEAWRDSSNESVRRLWLSFKKADKEWHRDPVHLQRERETALRIFLQSYLTTEEKKDQLGPTLTPAQTLVLRRGTQRDLEALYAGFCRVCCIPARFDPVSNVLQRWEKNNWLNVDLGIREKRKVTATGILILKPADSDSATMNARFNREWGVQVWRTDHFEDVDLGFESPLGTGKRAELPEGFYLLTSGARRKDGSATIRLEWFTVKAGKEVKVEMRMPKERMKDEG